MGEHETNRFQRGTVRLYNVNIFLNQQSMKREIIMGNERINVSKTEIRVKRVFGSQDFMDIYAQYAMNKYFNELQEMLELEPKHYKCSYIGTCKNLSERN